MSNIDIKSSAVRLLFRPRTTDPEQPVITDKERQDVEADYGEDSIGVEATESVFPLRLEFEYWRRHCRRNFDWNDMHYLADCRVNVNLAVVTILSGAKSCLVRSYRIQYQMLPSLKLIVSLSKTKRWLCSHQLWSCGLYNGWVSSRILKMLSWSCSNRTTMHTAIWLNLLDACDLNWSGWFFGREGVWSLWCISKLYAYP